MCGILVDVHRRHPEKCAENGCLDAFLQAHAQLKHRGPDSSNVVELYPQSREIWHGWLGVHRLAMVGRDDDQPMHDYEHQMWLAANCEFYDYHTMIKSKSLPVSDTRVFLERILHLLNSGTNVTEAVEIVVREVDGVFSFATVIGNQLLMGRDFWGVRPLYFSVRKNEQFVAASEIKALKTLKMPSITALNPGTMATIDLDPLSLNFMKVRFQSFIPTQYHRGIALSRRTHSRMEAIKVLQKLITKAIQKRIECLQSVAILLSGGLDSSVLAVLLNDLAKEYGVFVQGIVVGGKSSKDLRFVTLLERQLDFPLLVVIPNEKSIKELILPVIEAIESFDLKQFTIAVPLALACQQIQKLGMKALITGQGADELFGGYHRYRELFLKNPAAAREEMERDLDQIASQNLERDDKVAMRFGLELRPPYLDLELSAFARSLPVTWKLQVAPENGNNDLRNSQEPLTSNHVRTKVILRELGRTLSLPEPIVERKKTAFQYGSDVMKILRRLSKKEGYKKLKDWFNAAINV